MPEYLSPGVYIEEFEIGAKPIEGVSTSTAGFLGEAERGPTTPQLVTSWLGYQRLFGSYFGADKYLPYAMEGFFMNGGQRCYIGRIVKAGNAPATTATLKLTAAGANALTVEAVGEGSWGERIALKVTPGTFSTPAQPLFKLSVFYWKEKLTSLYDPDTDLTTQPRPAVTEVFDNLSVTETSPDYFEKRVNGISNFIKLSKKSGDSGAVPELHAGTAQSGTAESTPTITLANAASATDDEYNGMQIEITGGTGSGQTRSITGYDGATRVATVDANWDTVPDNTSIYRILNSVHDDTAQGATANTITLANAASATNDEYNGMQIEITGGTGSGQTRSITGYDGATRVATVDANWDTVPDNTSIYRILNSVHDDTAQGATANTITLANAASATNDEYNGMQIEITGGTGSGQTRSITGYDGATRVATVDANWDTVPDNTSIYRILNSVHDDTAQGATANTITLANAASATDDEYNGMQIEITGGTGSGQTRSITNYVGATRVATVDANWDTIPDNTSTYRILNSVHNDTAQVAAAELPPTITLANDASATNDIYNTMQIEITGGTGSGQTRSITGYDGATRVATVDANWDTVPENTSTYCVSWPIRTLKGGFDSLVHNGTAQAGAANTITLANAASEADDEYNGMQIEITGGTGSGQTRSITGYDGATRVATVDANWDTVPDNTSTYCVFDSTPDLALADYKRTDTNEPGNRKGLTGFSEIDEISIVCAPNSQSVIGLPGALISHCETLKDRFAIIDAVQGAASISRLDPRSDRPTKYAAFYYPWIKVIDPEAGLLRLVPPGGHCAGIYARSDTERGVHKAPANEVVRGAADLEFQITKGEQDILNPRGVNVIRAFPGRGIRVWGARTLSSNTLWKYINVRRLFLYIEESIEEGTQWVVFEPNDEKLWARVRATITQFLTRVWRDGALMGTKAEEAFFVKCDRTTMTQDDIDNGRLICVIGVAPVKPAEFVIFRIAQWSGGSSVTE